MSTFCGLMREYGLVSLDRFDKENLSSTVYMLSHKHADHMVGLGSDLFAYRLRSNREIKLYCSPITRDLLLLDDKYSHLKKSIVAKEVNLPWTLDIPNLKTGQISDKVTVTMLPSGHCPGSVMFLFEGSEGRVLYTGDFRLTVQDITNMSHLHSGSLAKQIKSMYVDTTFCVPHASYIPSRQDSVSAVIDLIQSWLDMSSRHYVSLQYKASLGYEHLFMEISKHFGMPVHVNRYVQERYLKVADLANYTTSDPSKTRIHACRCRKSNPTTRLPCGYHPGHAINVRAVGVATMCFIQPVARNVFMRQLSPNYYKVCYSFHSSYSEIKDIVHYLKPQAAYPNVIALNETLEQMERRLDGFVRSAHSSCQFTASPEYQRLGTLKKTNVKKRKPRYSDSDSLEFCDHGYSPKKKPKRRHRNDLSDSELFPTILGRHDNHSEEEAESRMAASDEDWMTSEDEGQSEEEMRRSFSQPDGEEQSYGEHCSMVVNDCYDEDEGNNGCLATGDADDDVSDCCLATEEDCDDVNNGCLATEDAGDAKNGCLATEDAGIIDGNGQEKVEICGNASKSSKNTSSQPDSYDISQSVICVEDSATESSEQTNPSISPKPHPVSSFYSSTSAAKSTQASKCSLVSKTSKEKMLKPVVVDITEDSSDGLSTDSSGESEVLLDKLEEKAYCPLNNDENYGRIDTVILDDDSDEDTESYTETSEFETFSSEKQNGFDTSASDYLEESRVSVVVEGDGGLSDQSDIVDVNGGDDYFEDSQLVD